MDNVRNIRGSDRAQRVIESCLDPNQLNAAEQYAFLWLKKHGLLPDGETSKAIHVVITGQLFVVFRVLSKERVRQVLRPGPRPPQRKTAEGTREPEH